jgi:hypothetical protein
MNNYAIKITGSGSKDEIVEALEGLINSIKESSEQELESAEWEDGFLNTEIHEESFNYTTTWKNTPSPILA